jgi:hypothetical protein
VDNGQPGSDACFRRISTDQRACIDRSGQLLRLAARKSSCNRVREVIEANRRGTWTITRKPGKWNPGQNHFSDYATQELATRLKNGQDVGVSSTERQPSLMMTFRVVAFHLHAFFHRQLRQMPNEEYQFPVVLRSVGRGKGRHASEADSVFDDPE